MTISLSNKTLNCRYKGPNSTTYYWSSSSIKGNLSSSLQISEIFYQSEKGHWYSLKANNIATIKKTKTEIGDGVVNKILLRKGKERIELALDISWIKPKKNEPPREVVGIESLEDWTYL